MEAPSVLTFDTRRVINNSVPIDLLRKRSLALRWMWFAGKPLVSGERHLAAWQRCNSEILDGGEINETR